MAICLERSADLHMAQLIPLLLTVRAFQFAIRIDSIRYANRFESISLVKIGLSIH